MKEAEQALLPEIEAARAKEFDQLVKENGDITVQLPDDAGNMRAVTLRQLAEENKADMDFISEITSCAVNP